MKSSFKVVISSTIVSFYLRSVRASCQPYEMDMQESHENKLRHKMLRKLPNSFSKSSRKIRDSVLLGSTTRFITNWLREESKLDPDSSGSDSNWQGGTKVVSSF